jgi:hypothetical protein
MNTMTDQLEQNLRDAFSDRDAQLDPNSIARLRAADYHPRRHRMRRLPAFGALGATGLAATAGVIVALGSSAAPAFAGWQATPRTTEGSQPAQAPPQGCGAGLGAPVLTDSRGPYSASIYAQSTTSAVCLAGNGISMSSSSSASSIPTIASGQVEFAGGGMRDTAGSALTLADGRTGARVTGVAIELSDGSSVQATVGNGWYLAWWPGDVSATQVQITTASGTTTTPYPSRPAPTCPTDANCSMGYGFSGDGSQQAGQRSMTISGSSRVNATS